MFYSYFIKRLVRRSFDDVNNHRCRAIVTNNLRDFRALHAELIASGGSGHAGMMFVPTNLRLTKADAGRIITALEAKLVEYPGEQDLANGEFWV